MLATGTAEPAGAGVVMMRRYRSCSEAPLGKLTAAAAGAPRRTHSGSSAGAAGALPPSARPNVSTFPRRVAIRQAASASTRHLPSRCVQHRQSVRASARCCCSARCTATRWRMAAALFQGRFGAAAPRSAASDCGDSSGDADFHAAYDGPCAAGPGMRSSQPHVHHQAQERLASQLRRRLRASATAATAAAAPLAH